MQVNAYSTDGFYSHFSSHAQPHTSSSLNVEIGGIGPIVEEGKP